MVIDDFASAVEVFATGHSFDAHAGALREAGRLLTHVVLAGEDWGFFFFWGVMLDSSERRGMVQLMGLRF